MMKGNDSRLKILMIALTGPSPERPHQAVFIRRWAEQLFAAGCDVRVFTRRHITFGTYLSSLSRIQEYYATPRYFHYDWDGIPVDGIRLHLRFPLNYSKSSVDLTYSAIREPLREIYGEFPFDLMYMATWGDFSLAAARVAKTLGVPYVATAIGGYENRYYNKPDSLPYRIQRELYLGSELVQCVSKDLERKIRIMTDGRVPTWTWESGVDLEQFAPSVERRQRRRADLCIAEDQILITFVGRLVKEKGIDELFDAFGVLAREEPRTKLALVGHAHKEGPIRRKLGAKGLEERVVMVGGVPAKEIPGYLNATDLFVFPSWNEGLPNAVKEASACALPIVATNVGGIPEIIEDGVTGLLVPPRSADALFEALRRLVADVDLCSKLGTAAREAVSKAWDYHKNGPLLVEKIRGIIPHCS